MASGGLDLLDRPDAASLQRGPNAARSRSRSFGATSSPIAVHRQSNFEQFPQIPETAVEHLLVVKGKDSLTEEDLISVGIKNLDTRSTSSGTATPDNQPLTPPGTIFIASERECDGSLPAFLEDMRTHSMFDTSTERFQLAPPEATIVQTSTPVPISPPQDAPRKRSFRRRSWLPPSSRPSSPDKDKTRAGGEKDRKPGDLEEAREFKNSVGDGKSNSQWRNPWVTSSSSVTSASDAPKFRSDRLPHLDSSTYEKKSKQPMNGFFISSPATPGNESYFHHVLSPQTPVPSPNNSESQKPPAHSIHEGLDPLNSAPRASISANPSNTSPLPQLDTRLQMKKSRRPFSGIFGGSATSSPATPRTSQDEPRSVPPMVKSFSMDRLPTLKDSLPSFDRLSNLSKPSSEKLRSSYEKGILKRDELRSAFKGLDADYQKFIGKSVAVKATIVRGTLLPFLRTSQSTQKLRVEDLERRVTILNKWWSGLLDVLQCESSQSMSPSDRPTILDGIVGIMERPEWRSAPSDYAPTSERQSLSSCRTRPSSVSDAGSSDFLVESIHHNNRNILIHNLLTQMKFVVDKMSAKITPSTVVSFCGKTCAYAFFFCPGMAKFLISLWKLNMDPMRRVLGEAGVPRHSVMGDVSRRIASGFPSHLQELKLESLTKTFRSLQQSLTPPLRTAQYNWMGPWVSRWQGKESDLFYVFFKNYHLLAMDFLPVHAKKLERICAPGLLMVHAQLLTNLDATIHRNANQADESKNGPSSTTFDDYLSDPDATATTLPVAPLNANRLMAENRVIMLLRDCLSEKGFKQRETRHFTASCLSEILQAGARKTSLFDSSACYTLCEFLEEAIAIFVRYDQSCEEGEEVFDWQFWIAVWKKMVESQNTTTEIRLYSLLFCIWPAIAADPDRQADICCNFLLHPDVFLSRFNHWCPMTRAYYMRLLSWRIARYDTADPPSNTRTLATLMERLSTVWAYFLYTKQAPGTDIPSNYTATPSAPAPGRRLLIIRTDPVANHNGGVMLSPDDSSQRPTLPDGRRRSNSWMDTVASPEWRPDSSTSTDSSESTEQDDSSSVRRWPLIRNVIGATARARSQSPRLNIRSDGTSNPSGGSGRSSPVPSLSDQLASGDRYGTNHSRQRSGSMPPAPDHFRNYNFKFSLEYVDRRFAAYRPVALSPPRLPLPAQQHLRSKYDLTALFADSRATRPPTTGPAAGCGTYVGRALAEWSMVVKECQNFFDRRIREGAPGNGWVETPALGVETFKRPG